MDPQSGISALLSIIKTVIDIINSLKENVVRTKLLSQRIERLKEALEKMQETKRVILSKAFGDIKTCLQECIECINGYSKRNWLMRVIKTKGLNQELDELNEKLRDCVQDLNLYQVADLVALSSNLNITNKQLQDEKKNERADTPSVKDNLPVDAEKSYNEALLELTERALPIMLIHLEQLKIPTFTGDISLSTIMPLLNMDGAANFTMGQLSLTKLDIVRDSVRMVISEKFMDFQMHKVNASVRNFDWQVNASAIGFEDQGTASADMKNVSVLTTFEISLFKNRPRMTILCNSVIIDQLEITINHEHKEKSSMYSLLIHFLKDEIRHVMEKSIAEIIAEQFQPQMGMVLADVCAKFIPVDQLQSNSDSNSDESPIIKKASSKARKLLGEN